MPGVSDRVSGFTLGLSALGVSLILYGGATSEKGECGVWRWEGVGLGVVGTYVRPVERRTPARKADTVGNGVLARRAVANCGG
jgi:hypothetical protein